jgi:hypothetical protein
VLRRIRTNGRAGIWYVSASVDSAVTGAGVAVMPGVRIANSSGVIAASVIPPARMIDRNLVGHCVVEDCVVEDCIAAPFLFQGQLCSILGTCHHNKDRPHGRRSPSLLNAISRLSFAACIAPFNDKKLRNAHSLVEGCL